MLLASNDRPAPRGGRVWAAAVAAAVLGTALLVSGVGFARPDDDKKAGDKKADDKKAEFDPKDVRVGPPPELAALREAVERAAKKGENVEEVRKSLDALEKALAGQAWVRPKAAAPPAAPEPPVPPLVFPQPNVPGAAPPIIAFPAPIPPDRELLKKATDQIQRANALLAKDPTDKDAQRLLKEAREMMMNALRAPIAAVPPVPGFPGFPGAPGVAVGGFGGFAQQQVRLGVRVEKVPAALADQLDLPKGRGVLVADVGKDTPAEKAGLKANDIIVEFAGKPVSDDPTEFVRAVQGLKKDEKVDVTFLRKGRKDTAKGVEVPEAKAGALFPNPGAFPEPIAIDFPAVPVPPQPPALGGAASSSVSIQVSDRSFTIDAVQDGTKIHIEGEVQADGSAAASKVVITDPKGEKVADVKDVDKVPADYRDRVKKLLSGVKGGK